MFIKFDSRVVTQHAPLPLLGLNNYDPSLILYAYFAAGVVNRKFTRLRLNFAANFTWLTI